MIKPPIDLQDLRRRIYVKAKASLAEESAELPDDMPVSAAAE